MVTDVADGFTIAVPRGWEQVNLPSPGAQATLESLEQVDPSLDAVFGGDPQQIAADGVKFRLSTHRAGPPALLLP